jgi:elongation factor Ts
MTISAELVKELRERTGAGMMDCKKALTAANGDIDLAIENMRKAGRTQADKKANRVTAEGTIIIKTSADQKSAAMLEINCETDFVARDAHFRQFANLVANRALDEKIVDPETLMHMPMDKESQQTIEEARQTLVATLGENVQVRRVQVMSAHGEGIIGSYLHGDRIGVLVHLSGDDPVLGKDLGMHIAASRPRAIAPEDIAESVIEKEKEIFMAQAQSSGKPVEIIEKMVKGRVDKFLNEETLLGQPFVKNPTITVGNLLINANSKVLAFTRFEVGEGIERKAGNFAEEVMAQVRGSK